MVGRVAGKVAIVTGGGSRGRVPGVGQAISEVLAFEGAAVVVVDRDQDAAARTVATIRSAGGTAFEVIADITSEQECRRSVEETVAKFGGLDILVNNAAINNHASRRITDVEEASWDRVHAVNVKAPLFMMKHAIPAMSGSGSIVSISSLVVAQPSSDCAYNASKGGLESLTMVAAMNYGKEGIRANCVRPGAVWTEMIAEQYTEGELRDQVRRDRASFGAIEIEGSGTDIATATLFLASDEARWVTGQVINVDGGWATKADLSFLDRRDKVAT
jgi:NAD(P)-dependent dehydrogenase (short-subunit alcohol dehydrogenase family)